jgi:ankyrin repeat protein
MSEKSLRLIVAAQRGDISVVSSLLSEENGIDVNAQNRDGSTALMMASQAGHERVVSLLLERGAQLEIPNMVRYFLLFSLSICLIHTLSLSLTLYLRTISLFCFENLAQIGLDCSNVGFCEWS